VGATAWVFREPRAPVQAEPAATRAIVPEAAPSIPPPTTSGSSKAPVVERLGGGTVPPPVLASKPEPAGAPAPPVRGDWGRVSVTTSPPSIVTINRRHVPYPVYRWRVSPGEVRLRFLANDSAGAFTRDTIIIVKPGEEKLLGTLVLRRR
jgi:hypothetical protein